MAKRTDRAARTKRRVARSSGGKPARPSRARRGRAAGAGGPAKVVKVKAPGSLPAGYEVRIGAGLLPGACEGLITAGRAALVVVDSHLGSATVEPLLRALDRARVRWGVCVVAATEQDKSLATAERALAEAGRIRLGRDGLVAAVGGGIVGDLGGFVAGVFGRGVAVVQCPTTLLAMVDASVGGKTGVNLAVPAGGPGESVAARPRLVKNMVGVFHQPARVVCDVGALKTLARREVRCGLAECLKHGLIGGGVRDAGLLDWTERSLDRILALEERTLVELVARNVGLKARVVAADPREQSRAPDGGRMMLNLGHTFAHALETLPGLSWMDGSGGEGGEGSGGSEGGEGSGRGMMQIGPLKHGEAVGLGLLAACRLAERLRLVRPALAARLAGLMQRIGLPTRVSGLPGGEAIVERMMDDKKVAGGRLRLILPVKGLRCRVVIDPARAAVIEAIESLGDGGSRG